MAWQLWHDQRITPAETSWPKNDATRRGGCGVARPARAAAAAGGGDGLGRGCCAMTVLWLSLTGRQSGDRQRNENLRHSVWKIFPPDRGGRRMAYNQAAIKLRRCTATKADGSPCRAWATWDDPFQRCVNHAGRHHTGRCYGPRYRSMLEKARYRPCRCGAYAWPHRPGGGLCRWPLPPVSKPIMRRTEHAAPAEIINGRPIVDAGAAPIAALPVPETAVGKCNAVKPATLAERLFGPEVDPFRRALFER